MKLFTKFFPIAIGFLIAAVIFVIVQMNPRAGLAKKTSTNFLPEIKFRNQTISLELARTPEKRERGLSGRDALGFKQGMLFIFEVPGKYGFWMPAMKFPIDIVWLAGNNVVGFEENVDPQIGAKTQDLKIYYPPQPVNRVLELNAGFVRVLNIKIHDTIDLQNL